MTTITMPTETLRVHNKPNKYGERAVMFGDTKIGYIKKHRVPAHGSRTMAEWDEYWAENPQVYRGYDWCAQSEHRASVSNDALRPADTVESAALSVYAAWVGSQR